MITIRTNNGWPKWRITGIAALFFIGFQYLLTAWVYPSTSQPFRAPKPSFSPLFQEQYQISSSVFRLTRTSQNATSTTINHVSSKIVSSQLKDLNSKYNSLVPLHADPKSVTSSPSRPNGGDLNDSINSIQGNKSDDLKRCGKNGENAHGLCDKGKPASNHTALSKINVKYTEYLRNSGLLSHENQSTITPRLLKVASNHQSFMKKDDSVLNKYSSSNSQEESKEKTFEEWKVVMNERKQRIQEICGPFRDILRRFMNHNRLLFDTKHHVAYCRNAKAGTTTWLSYLLEASGINTANMTTIEIHAAAEKEFPSLPPKIAAEEMGHTPLLFTVVRHPFTRLVSAYRDKMPENYRKDLQLQMVAKYRNRTDAQLRDYFQDDSNSQDRSTPTFREFALFVSHQILACDPAVNSACLSEVDAHWRPFYDRCAPCDLHYEVIAKVETFHDDENYIRKLAGLTTDSSLSRGVTTHIHASNGPSSADLAKLYFSQLTDAEKQIVFDAYYFDFLLFGYSPDVIT